MADKLHPITFRIPEACAYLGISEYLLRKLVREQKIPYIRAGKLFLFRQASLDAFLSEAEKASIPSSQAVMHGIRSVAL